MTDLTEFVQVGLAERRVEPSANLPCLRWTGALPFSVFVNGITATPDWNAVHVMPVLAVRIDRSILKILCSVIVQIRFKHRKQRFRDLALPIRDGYQLLEIKSCRCNFHNHLLFSKDASMI